MPATTLPDVDHFVPVQPSKEKIDFVSLHTVDLATYDDGLDTKKQIAEQVRQAMTTQGFFTLINHGITEEEISRQVDIGHTILKRTSQEEKERLRAPIREEGNYYGFKPRGVWRTIGQAVDKIEQFNISRDMSLQEQPKAMEPFRSEVQNFVDRTHKDVLFKVLRLFAIALELDDEDFFVKLHDYDSQDLSWLRWMEYYDEHNEADVEERTLWLQGHRDLTCTTILFSQPMSTLQVRDYHDGSEWKYVEHVPGAIIINAGEIMQWFTGGYFKAAIHRVTEPPKDQQGHDRSSVFYFSVPNDDVVINTILDRSPVLRKAGVELAHKPEDAPTSNEWVSGRIKITGKNQDFDKNGNSIVEKVGKVTTKWFR